MGLAILGRANAMSCSRRWRSRSGSGAGFGPPVALVVAAALTVAPWTIRNAVTLHAFVPVSTQLGSALAGTYNSEARADKVNPASWRTLKRVDDYRPIFSQIRTDPEPVLEQQLRTASLDFIKEHPGYVLTVGYWTTRRMLDLAGMDWSIHTAATISADPRLGDRGRHLLLDLRAAGAVRRDHPPGASGTALAVDGAAADVPRRRLPGGRDAALPDRDRSVHRAAGRAGAHAVAQIAYPLTFQLLADPPWTSRALIEAPVSVAFGVMLSNTA